MGNLSNANPSLVAEVLGRRPSLARKLAALSSPRPIEPALDSCVQEAEDQFQAMETCLKVGNIEAAQRCMLFVEKALQRFEEETKRKKESARQEQLRLAAIREQQEAVRKEQEAIRRRKEEEACCREAEFRAAQERELRQKESQLKAERELRRQQRLQWMYKNRVLISIGFAVCFTGFVLVFSRIEKEATRKKIVKQLIANMINCPDVSPGFLLGKFEVTQEEWSVITGDNPAHLKGKKCPVDQVSWRDCTNFIAKLNRLPETTESNLKFRLPTSKEWSMACRAGAPPYAAYCKMTDRTQIQESTLIRVAHYDNEGTASPAVVGSLEPNAWGFYDMHGNVWEWMSTGNVTLRQYGGGSYIDSAHDCRADYRGLDTPDYRAVGLGLRLAADVTGPTQQLHH